MTNKEIYEMIKNTDKKIYLTIGLRYRHPSTLDELVSKEYALRNIEWCALAEVTMETPEKIYLTVYSDNDMW